MHASSHLRRSLGLALGVLAFTSAPALAVPVDRAAGLAAHEQQALASRRVGPDALERLRMIEQTRVRALVDADVTAAGRLIATDFELINPLGEVLTRDALLGAVGSGAVDFLSDTVTSRIRLRRHGNTAVLRYMHTVDIQVAGVGHLTHPAWSTALYERRNGRWQIVWEQTGAIGPLPAPS